MLNLCFPPVDIPVKRKIEKKREKVLYHESVLKRNPFVQPVPSSVVSKKDKEKTKDLLKTNEEKIVPVVSKKVKKAKKNNKKAKETQEEKISPMVLTL